MVNEIQIKTIEEYNEITSKDKVFVMVYTTWCPACNVTLPNLEEASDEESMSGIKFYKMDMDTHKDISKEIKARVVPMMFLYRDGIEVKRTAGTKSKEAIMEFITLNLTYNY